MKRIWLFLVAVALMAGCSNVEPAEVEEPKAEKEKTREENKHKTTEEHKEYIFKLGEEMDKIHDLLVETSEIAEKGHVVIAGSINIRLELPIMNIELLKPPSDLKKNHETILNDLKAAKHAARFAMESYMEKDFDEGDKMLEISGEALERAVKTYNKLADK